MTYTNLEEKLHNYSNPYDMMFNNRGATFSFPVPPEFTNFQDEQRAWKKTAILQDMSFHMTEITIEGKDVNRLLTALAVNSMSDFAPMVAKQLVVCNYDGKLIGDAIMISEREEHVNILGMAPAIHWVEFHAQSGDYEVEITNKEYPGANPADRERFRLQVQGPNAEVILSELNAGSLPDIPFFKMGSFNIGEHKVTALNHRMSGAPGYEFWGPMEEADSVKTLVLEAGKKHGLKQIGGRSYPVTAVISGWMGGVLPAIFTDSRLKKFREWLPADSAEANWSIGGSWQTNDIRDLYLTPYDVGYGFMVKFDHDFIGRKALEMLAPDKQRKKVRLVWNAEDVTEIHYSLFAQDIPYKYMEVPVAGYASSVIDEVFHSCERIGMSATPVYSSILRSWVSLAVVRSDLAIDDTELTVVWGEPDGGSSKPRVECHRQKRVRVTVDSKPIKRG